MSSKRSASKTARAAERKRLRNRPIRSRAKTCIAAAEAGCAAREGSAGESVRLAISSVDRAGSKGIFHRNKVDRIKSRLAKKANALAVSDAG